MKRITAILFLLVLCIESNGTGRVYVSTDRNAYIAGERVWCSLFNTGIDGTITAESAIAYVELLSENGSALQTKIGLMKGRGSGEFSIPSSLPTGNYRLVAYTAAQNPESASAGSRIISIYNTFSGTKLGSVKVSETVPAIHEEDYSDGISISVPAFAKTDSHVSLNLSSDMADISVSIYHEDQLIGQPLSNIAHFFEQFPLPDEPDYSKPEATGEIIHAVASGVKGTQAAILSCAGSVEDTYIANTSDDGTIVFPTGNIYGDKEMVCEIPDGGNDVRLQILSPYRHPKSGDIPSLTLSKDMFAALVNRKASLNCQVAADTLVEFLPRRIDPVFGGVAWERYNLDDYQRFPTVKEVIIEILNGLKVRRYEGKPIFQLMTTNQGDSRRILKDHILAMMDGVVISDPELILSFDAMLLQEVMICRQPVVFGNLLYNGVVNFVTKKNYVTALSFAPRVRVIDFHGVRYPVAYTGEKPKESAQDLRKLLYWHPSLKVNGMTSILINTPSYTGRFRVVCEGIGKDGKPVAAVTSFEVR